MEAGEWGLGLFPIRCLKCHSTKNLEGTCYCQTCWEDWSKEENGGDRCFTCDSTSELEKDKDDPGTYYCQKCWEKWLTTRKTIQAHTTAKRAKSG